MRSWRRYVALLTGGAALSLAAAVPASGNEPGWQVGPVSPAAFTGQNEGNFVRTLNQVPETCTQVTMGGSLVTTNDPAGAVGTVSTAAFTAPGKPCSSVLGNITRLPQPGWQLVAEGYDAATATVSGRITNYTEKGNVGATAWTIAGEIPWTYENNTGRLKMDASGTDLTVVASRNGGAWLPVGSPVTFKGTLRLTLPGNNAAPTLTPQS